MKNGTKQVIVKPCPFCGNPATVREASQEERPKWSGTYGEWWIVECSNEYCLIYPKISFPNKREAVSEWNIRRGANSFTYDPQENIIEFEN